MEERGLVVVKDNLFVRVTQSIKKFFYKGKMKEFAYEHEENEELNDSMVRLVHSDAQYVQIEVLNARKAFRQYVINNKIDISTDILVFVKEKIQKSSSKMKRLIKINKEDISYEDIIRLLDDEIVNVANFKKRNEKTKRFNIPIGVIGVECNDSKTAVENIFKAVSTRNAIMILQDAYNEYSIEALVLMMVKESLKHFNVSGDLVQLFDKIEIDERQLDKIIKGNREIVYRSRPKTIYIYLEDKELENKAMAEVKKLKNMDNSEKYNIEVITGNFADVVNFFYKNEAVAICMYTGNTQKAYKFMNWVNCPNVFINTGVCSCGNDKNYRNKYYNSKLILHKDIF